MIVLLAPPQGEAYNFIVNLCVAPHHIVLLPALMLLSSYTYPGVWVNAFVSGGLIYLRLSKTEVWTSPFKSFFPIIVLYLLINIFLAIVPFIPPTGSWTADGYPYYVFPVVGVAVLLGGAVYWVVFAKVWPRIHGYQIETERIQSDDEGREVIRHRKVYTKGSAA